MFQQQHGGNALVGRIAVREVPPDVAQRQRAEQRVHQRVYRHVGVGMAVEPPVVGHLHAA